MYNFILPGHISEILSRIRSKKHDAYIVGGCVRDMLMKTEPNDYDICTDALPDEITAIFSDMTVIETGIVHGTVTVIYNSHSVEITTFRTESGYSDGRHPDHVCYAKTLDEDLKRRDFTVNAMAYSEESGLIDPYGGRTDAENHVLRCVGDPNKRFSEDALRILRAVRFASCLGMEIEKETAEAMSVQKDMLLRISHERVLTELNKILCGKYFEKNAVKHRDILSTVIPELSVTFDYCQNNPHHTFDLYTHLIKTVTACPDDRVIRMAALLHDIGKPECRTFDSDGTAHYYGHAAISAEIANRIALRLRMSTRDREYTVKLIHYHDSVIEETEKAVKRRLCRFGEQTVRDLFSLQRADNASQTEDINSGGLHYDRLEEILNGIIESGSCTDRSTLAVNGYDIIKLGITGKEIGKTLDLLLHAVLDGKVKNDKEALLSFISAEHR